MSDPEKNKPSPDVSSSPKPASSDTASLSKTTDSEGPYAFEENLPSLKEGDKLGKYEVVRQLGKGGMGAVYLAFDPMIERQVAIKVLPPQIASQGNALKRFLGEARATGKLNHPNVVAIYDIDQDRDQYYLVMELVQGGSVGDLLTNGPVSWQQACRLAADACDGLQAAHAAGLVHRDVKPDNLMVTNEGRVKVVDFGLSKLTDAVHETRMGLTSAGQILGTPHYMSPEQFQGQAIDARSDVYSMGGTFYTLLTGERPFAAAANVIHLMTAHAKQPPPDPSDVNSSIPAACGEIVARAMAKDPDKRYQTAGDLASALRAAAGGGLDGGSAPAMSARPLRAAVVAEPSKMQAMMLGNTIRGAGAETVVTCDAISAARSQREAPSVDLLVTAMVLADGKGSDLIRDLRENPLYAETVLVLHSSDSNIQQLVEIGQNAPLAVMSKKAKPDYLLKALHCCSLLDLGGGLQPPEVDSTSLRLLFVSETTKIPPPIAKLVRRANLLDVQFTSFDELASGKQLSGAFDLAVGVHLAGDATQDAWLYTDLLSRMNVGARASAALQVDGDRVLLRAVEADSFTAIVRTALNASSVARLLPICRI